MWKEEYSTHIGDEFLYDRHHAGHVVEDGDEIVLDLLQGERVVVLHLVGHADLRTMPMNQSGE